ncbi:MAG: hypothetical protein Q8J65_05980 [Nitrosomonadales bacterium]|nr:hypothetical protein [Nitrosomonadales bacterium]
MTRNKLLALAAAFSITASITTYTQAATPATVQSTVLGITEMNGPFNNTPTNATGAFDELAVKYFHGHSMKTKIADVGLFAGPHSMFVNEPNTSFPDSSAGSMMLASLGLMALIVRRRMMM